MEEHDENENWFSSLIGLFYEYGIINHDDDDITNKNKSLEFYLLAINRENKKLVSIYQILRFLRDQTSFIQDNIFIIMKW